MTLPVWSQTDFNTIFSPLTRLSDAFAPRAQAIPAMTVALHPGHVFNGIALVEAGAYLTGDLAEGSAVISNLSTVAGLHIGLQVDGLGIPPGTVISAIGSGTVTLSANGTATLQANALIASQVTPAFTAPVTDPRIDRIVIDQRTGLLSVVAGAEAATPVAPAIPAGQVPVAQVRLEPGDIAITAAMITDERDAPRLGHGYRATDTESGMGYSYLATDHYRVKLRSNAGAAMIDTLPGSSPGVMPAGWQVTIGNADTGGILALTVGSGATLDGGSGTILYVGPGQRVTVVSDGANYATSEKPDRCRLGAATSLYVATTGSDSNHGLTTAAPFATIQKAVDVLQDRVDLNGNSITIQVADGSYSAGVVVRAPFIGAGSVSINGNYTTPANCSINSSNGSCFHVQYGAVVHIGGFMVSTSGSGGHVIFSDTGSTINVTGPLVFGQGTAGARHVMANSGAYVYFQVGYTIVAGSSYHWTAQLGGRILAPGISIALSGNPAFTWFATADSLGQLICYGIAFSGAATGMRYISQLNSLIITGGGGPTYFPGDSPGSATSGGIYA